MKPVVAICMALLYACAVFGIELPALPQSEFADTEVSTNLVFAVGEGANRRLVFSLELEATPTNNVEVAIGCDVDEDGLLSLDEAALTVGYRDVEGWFHGEGGHNHMGKPAS